MKKIYIIIIIISAIVTLILNNTGSGLEVDVDEIRTKPVKFINYQGTYERPDAVNAIEGIGRSLSLGKEGDSRINFYLKYSIIHAVSKEEPEKLSADIFSINKEAKVGHIDMVRLITTSYLINKYGYTRQDAETLSLFLSYYNAIYRGNINYFSGKYKNIVLKYINAQNAGISTKYFEWAGATRMLIPLTEEAQKGKLDAIRTDVISDQKTIKEVSRDDRNIPKRKDMTDIKERIIEKDKKEIETRKENLGKETQKITEEKQPVEKNKQEIIKKEEDLKKEKDEAKKITDPEKQKEKQKEIEQKEKQMEAEKQEAKKKEEDLARKEEAVKKEQKAIAEQEKKIAGRETDLKKEKKDIERDEIKRDITKEPEKAREKLEAKAEELDKREDQLRSMEPDKSIYANKLYYLKIREYLEGGHYNNEMYMIDAATRKILFKSPEEYICGSRYDVFSGGVVVITHRGSHTMGHRLTILDRESLAATQQGEDNIFWRSFIEIRDGFIYVITYDQGKHFLGRFDSNLKLVAKSKEEINEDTFISFYENFIYINRIDKTIMVLNKNDLEFVDVVKP
jgi:hypothetical protein